MTTNRTRRLTAVLATSAMTVLVACSDDDAGGAMTADEYVAAGNELCEEAGAGVEEAFPDFEGEPTIEQVMQLGTDLAPVMERFRDGVAELAPPAEHEAGHAELLEALEGAIATTRAMGATAEGAEAALAAGGPPLDEIAGPANALFPSCPAE